MRCFLAVTPSLELALSIEQWRRHNWPVAGRAVSIQNLHMTLVFLGDLVPVKIETLRGLLNQRLSGGILSAPFEHPLDNAGYWPDSKVIWLGSTLGEDAGVVTTLVHTLRGLANRANIRVDKHPFTPHVTLARQVSMPPPAPLEPPALLLQANSVELYYSHLGPDGPRYEEIASWPLQAH